LAVKFDNRQVEEIKELTPDFSQFTLLLDKELSKSSRRAVLKEIQTKLGELLVRRMRARIVANKDKYNQLMPKYKKEYRHAKAKMISGKWKMREKVKTKYRAKNVRDRTRLSGRLVSDISFKRGKIQTPTSSKDGFIIVILYVKKHSVDKAMGLISSQGTTRNRKKYKKAKREFFGFTKKGLLEVQDQVFKRFNKL
jgi:hypothetical protein